MTQKKSPNVMLTELEQLVLSKFSIKHGFNFFFNDDSDVIRASNGSWFRKETVYINGEVKSEIRNFGKILSRHVIMHNDHEYEVTLCVVGFALGRLECSVLKDGYLIGREVQSIINSKNWWKGVLISCGCGAILGLLLAIVIKIFE